MLRLSRASTVLIGVSLATVGIIAYVQLNEEQNRKVRQSSA